MSADSFLLAVASPVPSHSTITQGPTCESWPALSMVPGAWSVICAYWRSSVLITGVPCLLCSLAVPGAWNCLRETHTVTECSSFIGLPFRTHQFPTSLLRRLMASPAWCVQRIQICMLCSKHTGLYELDAPRWGCSRPPLHCEARNAWTAQFTDVAQVPTRNIWKS